MRAMRPHFPSVFSGALHDAILILRTVLFTNGISLLYNRFHLVMHMGAAQQMITESTEIGIIRSLVSQPLAILQASIGNRSERTTRLADGEHRDHPEN